MHGAMKRYQHRHMQFGSLASTCEVDKLRFYGPYLKAIGLVLLGMAVGTLLLPEVLFACHRSSGACGTQLTAFETELLQPA